MTRVVWRDAERAAWILWAESWLLAYLLAAHAYHLATGDAVGGLLYFLPSAPVTLAMALWHRAVLRKRERVEEAARRLGWENQPGDGQVVG